MRARPLRAEDGSGLVSLRSRQPGTRRRTPKPARLVEEAARQSGITRRAVSPEEIVERTVYALINEGARILEEGIAIRAGDIDIVYVYGYGFPARAAARCGTPTRSG